MPERWVLIREPDDALANARVSLGCKKNLGAYLTFRGDPEEVVDLLNTALEVAKTMLPAGQYTDKRERPQG